MENISTHLYTRGNQGVEFLQTNRQTDRQTERQRDRESDINTHAAAYQQDRQRDRQTDRQADRQGTSHEAPARQRHFLSFSYVCPEPVFVKMIIFI